MERNDAAFPPADRAPEPSAAAVRLATALAERLDAVVPRPFRVRAEGAWVAFYHGEAWDGSSDVAGVLDQPIDPDETDERWTFPGLAAGVAWNALSGAQDGVAETTTEPWPRLPGGGMAMPGTRTDGERVFLWYGPSHEREDGAVLSLRPIVLAELREHG